MSKRWWPQETHTTRSTLKCWHCLFLIGLNKEKKTFPLKLGVTINYYFVGWMYARSCIKLTYFVGIVQLIWPLSIVLVSGCQLKNKFSLKLFGQINRYLAWSTYGMFYIVSSKENDRLATQAQLTKLLVIIVY